MMVGPDEEPDYRRVWDDFRAHLEEELESAYLNAIAAFMRADLYLKAGDERAADELDWAHRHLGQAVGLRNAVTTMRVKVAAGRRVAGTGTETARLRSPLRLVPRVLPTEDSR